MLQNKPVLAELCSDVFPVEISEIIKGDTVRIVDVEIIPGVDIVCPEPTPENPKPSVKCPDCERETITLTVHDTIKVRDTAKEFFLNSEVEKSRSKINELSEKNDHLKSLLWRFGLIGFVLLLALISIVYLKIIR